MAHLTEPANGRSNSKAMVDCKRQSRHREKGNKTFRTNWQWNTARNNPNSYLASRTRKVEGSLWRPLVRYSTWLSRASSNLRITTTTTKSKLRSMIHRISRRNCREGRRKRNPSGAQWREDAKEGEFFTWQTEVGEEDRRSACRWRRHGLPPSAARAGSLWDWNHQLPLLFHQTKDELEGPRTEKDQYYGKHRQWWDWEL